MTKIVIPQHSRERQELASDPAASIWVVANAGSGKTHVLTQRVIRLLLSGVPPARILCLTFTKAAAAQMSTRVFDALSRWTTLDDDKLREAVIQTGAPRPTPADLLLARRLFTRTVETPGGLKIQTIHAFCERLLHLFPFEANVPARFEVADELRAQELLASAKRAAIEAAQRASDERKIALQLLADLAGPTNIDRLLADAMRLRARVRRFPQDLQDTLAQRLGVTPNKSAADIRLAIADDGMAPNRWREIATLLEDGSSRDKEQAVRLRRAAAARAREGASSLRTETLETYFAVFFDSKDNPRSALMTKGTAARHAGLDVELEAEQARIVGLRADLKLAEAVERTDALVLLANTTREIYERAKTAAGLLDFDDLIERTLAMLARSDAGWVLHKLDAGIAHVLVDEAQDTSSAQWKILESLTSDFASGHGGSEMKRSFFVVGDDKQSIFSFQGAEPLMFDTMRAAFERRFKAGNKPFERVTLKTSFRSVPGVLSAVDRIFEPLTHQDGLARPPDIWPIHESIKPTLPGLIEIWPAICAAPGPDPQNWSIPIDTPSEQDPPNIVADRVARKIKDLTSPFSDEWVHEDGVRRKIEPGDIIVLVRTRSAFFEAVIRALKRHHVNVAGADRLDVANHIAVMDLVAAGRTALLPQDDLSLAALLKSPLFGLSDADLMEIAPERPGTLIDALGKSSRPHHRSAHMIIRAWIDRAAGATPFAFYVELLGRDGGRRLMEARLGPEAHDAIDEFLRLALAHEQQGAPALVTFLDDVEGLEGSIRRDMEEPGNAVRVMTVHAAKGLEAKIVFLPDTCQVPDARLDPVVFDLNKDGDSPPVIVWSPRKGDDTDVVATARGLERQATMQEYRRLLYVALTRAEERLYIAGFYNLKEPPPDCWSEMIDATLGDGTEVPAFWDETESVRRIVSPGSQDLERRKVEPQQHPLGLRPEWLSRAADNTPQVKRVRPSSRVDDKAAARREGLAYGTAVHQLLQYLPDVPPEERAARGKVFLEERDDLVEISTREAAVAEALSILEHPDLAPLFSCDARAEVPIMGRIDLPDGTTRTVDGVVDRLVVTPERIIIADFKTGAPDGQMEKGYSRQLSLYRDVVQPLWPGRPVSCWLVWTRGPRVVDVTAQKHSP